MKQILRAEKTQWNQYISKIQAAFRSLYLVLREWIYGMDFIISADHAVLKISRLRLLSTPKLKQHDYSTCRSAKLWKIDMRRWPRAEELGAISNENPFHLMGTFNFYAPKIGNEGHASQLAQQDRFILIEKKIRLNSWTIVSERASYLPDLACKAQSPSEKRSCANCPWCQ